MPDQPPVTPGSVLMSCTLSPVIAGIVQTNADGHERMWHVDDPEKLGAHLGRGLLARMPAGPGRYREVGLLDQAQGVLVLPARFPDQDGRIGAVDVIALTPVSGNAIAEVEQTKREVAMAVHQSIPSMLHDGGAVILEPTRPDTGGSRWVRIFRRDSELSVWTSPQPDSDMWRPVFVGDNEARAILPLAESAAHDAAVLAANALASWQWSPWDVSLTFVPYDESAQDEPTPAREGRSPRRGLFGRRRRSEPKPARSPSQPTVNPVSVARSSIAAVQGHLRVVPLGGAHWTEARLGLGPWAARIVLDVDALEFRCESEIPGVLDTSIVEEIVGALPFEAPRATYMLSPGPRIVTLSYARPLAQLNPAVVREAARLLARATAEVTHELWDGLSPLEQTRLGALGISSESSLASSPDQMLRAEPTAHVEWDSRLAAVDTTLPPEPELPAGAAGVIPGPLGPQWAAPIAEIREVLDQFTSTMAIEVQRRDRDDEIYIQVSNEGDQLFAEAISNAFLEGASRLNATDMQRLSHLGWQSPLGEDPPNWHRTYDAGDSAGVAEHIAKTLRDAYGVDPESDGWLIKWTDPATEPTQAATVVPIAPPVRPSEVKKTAQVPKPAKKAAARSANSESAVRLAPEISNALQHLRNSLGTAFQTRERPTGGYDLITMNGHTYGVAEADFIRIAVNSSAMLRYGRGWGTKSVNGETGNQEWTVRADEFDLDRGDLGRLVGLVEGAKRWRELDAPRQSPKADQPAAPQAKSAALKTEPLGADDIAAMLRTAIQDGGGTHLDIASGFVRWQGDPTQGLLAEAGNGQPGTPTDKAVVDALVSVGWSRPRPRNGLASCWVELMLGTDEPEQRFAARLEAVAEIVLAGIGVISESDDR